MSESGYQNERKLSTKTQITQDEHLMLIGLLTLSAQHHNALAAIVKTAVAITGEIDEHGQPNLMGHTADAMWSDNTDFSELFRRLDITVRTEVDPLKDLKELLPQLEPAEVEMLFQLGKKVRQRVDAQNADQGEANGA